MQQSFNIFSRNEDENVQFLFKLFCFDSAEWYF